MKVATLRKVSWEDGQESALRLMDQARETGEDLWYQLNRQFRHHVRRHPWKAVAVALAAGALVGCVIAQSGGRS